jgi:hypothetical protein
MLFMMRKLKMPAFELLMKPLRTVVPPDFFTIFWPTFTKSSQVFGLSVFGFRPASFMNAVLIHAT